MKDDIIKVMFAYAFNLSDTFKRSNFRNRFSLKVVLKPLSNTKKLRTILIFSSILDMSSKIMWKIMIVEKKSVKRNSFNSTLQYVIKIRQSLLR